MSEYVQRGSEKWVTARLAPLAKGNYPLAKEAQKDMMEALAIALSQMPREMQVDHLTTAAGGTSPATWKVAHRLFMQESEARYGGTGRP